MNKVALCTTSATILSLALAVSTASAQSAAEPKANENAGIEEVIVTAQRRAQSLQDAALAVQSFDTDTLTQS